MHKSLAWRAGCALFASAIASGVLISPAQADALSLSNGWIRALPGGRPAAGYFTLTNGTRKRIVLVSASSPGCGMTMLHKTQDESGMSGMEDVGNISLAPGATLHFSPGGYHLMCMDPTRAIAPGNRVPVTLVFQDGAKVTAEFVVRNASGH